MAAVALKDPQQALEASRDSSPGGLLVGDGALAGVGSMHLPPSLPPVCVCPASFLWLGVVCVCVGSVSADDVTLGFSEMYGMAQRMHLCRRLQCHPSVTAQPSVTTRYPQRCPIMTASTIVTHQLWGT
jgi:hypothetical protein